MTAAFPESHLLFHHFGLAVRRPQEAETLLTALGYTLGEAVLDPGQNVHLKMGHHPAQPAVEIIWPAAPGGPIDGMTQRHTSGIIYHLCYETDDLAAALAGFEKAGSRVVCVSPPKSAPLFGGRKVSFYNVIGLGLIEILEP
ncbi:MAG: VOC family protein [Methylacidiphilales bacterium]|nr:VOC family protein [Candidatus Methylacidiphilales bacterium]